ncbi:MAG: DNA polymerase III subunit gamma/tau [Desulfatiglandaceae bacterium]
MTYYEVLARKWRPQRFEDVIGQEHVTQTLVNAIKTERLAHAYLFAGPRGVGKTSVARILAKAINCEAGDPGNPCNGCQSCKDITVGSSVDVQEIDGASNRGIDEIRELRENINYMPSSSRYRVYIIDEVHMLTLPAFNALLKTLEEPPPHVKFIFATTEAHKVPITILSRCQRFDFKRIPVAQIVQHLLNITAQEDIHISKTGLALIAREAEGGMRDAESLLDQVTSFSGKEVEDNQVIDILGIVDQNILFETSRSIIEGDQKKCLEIVEQIYNYGYDIKAFYRTLMQHFRDLLISLITHEGLLLDMSETDRERAGKQAEKAGHERLQIMLNVLIQHEEGLRYTTHPRILLETTLLQLCRVGDFLSFDELLKKVAALENRLGQTPSQAPSAGVHTVSEPAASWDDEERGEEPPRTAHDAEDPGEWERFVSFLASKSRGMSRVMKEWECLQLTGDTLELMKGSRSFSGAYFDDPENLEQLRGYCRDFFGRDLHIKLVGASKSPPIGKAPAPAAATEKAEKDPRGHLPPSVQDIIDVFKGEVAPESSPDKPESS